MKICIAFTRRSTSSGVEHGTLDPAHQRRIGLPWSQAFVERAFRVVRGTIEAAAHAWGTVLP